jgi:hypothetical protein
MLSVQSNITESFTFIQLGGIRFLGPMQGAMPMGPHGVPGFDGLSEFPLDSIRSPIISYNYTLDHQGLTSNVNCSYTAGSPIVYMNETVPTDGFGWVAYNGICPPGQDVIDPGTQAYYVPYAFNSYSLAFWACNATQPGDPELSYDIYLQGTEGGAYGGMTGNMTCHVSSLQAATFPVTYQLLTDYFNASTVVTPQQNTSPATAILTQLAINAIGDVFQAAQTRELNNIAESVITLGVKDYEQSPTLPPNETFLMLYEAMIEGLLEYEVSSFHRLTSFAQSKLLHRHHTFACCIPQTSHRWGRCHQLVRVLLTAPWNIT